MESMKLECEKYCGEDSEVLGLQGGKFNQLSLTKSVWVFTGSLWKYFSHLMKGRAVERLWCFKEDRAEEGWQGWDGWSGITADKMGCDLNGQNNREMDREAKRARIHKAIKWLVTERELEMATFQYSRTKIPWTKEQEAGRSELSNWYEHRPTRHCFMWGSVT